MYVLRYNNKSYKVDDIDFQASPKSTFTNEKGEELSYMDYYKRQYGLEIRDPNQPLLIHRPKKKALNEEDVEKLICLIPELCLLTGMTDAMRADFRIMKEVRYSKYKFNFGNWHTICVRINSGCIFDLFWGS